MCSRNKLSFPADLLFMIPRSIFILVLTICAPLSVSRPVVHLRILIHNPNIRLLQRRILLPRIGIVENLAEQPLCTGLTTAQPAMGTADS
jgi:hypothetical protein